MNSLNTVLYYFGITLFTIGNLFFWGVLLHFTVKTLYSNIMNSFNKLFA